MKKTGSLSISSENIFPIIKKWVYSDHDIFLREMISNGCDAITKLKKLDMMGEYTIPDEYSPMIKVIADPKEKTLKIIDNGLGMTAEEVEEYITQIAFSGATEFLEKYKDKTTEDDMIGHFGLGFYSAFMVAEEVEIDSRSYKEGAVPVHWVSDGGTEYEMQDGEKEEIGTQITIHLSEDNLAFANEYRVREVLEKYCSFMPVPIFLSKVEEEKEKEAEKEDSEKTEPKPVNDTTPLWGKHPNECTKEDYIEFYRKVFMDYKEPLFWIHLNMDYPFNLKGILYFPKINTEYDSLEGTIKLYNNQVFIADNIREVIPEFLMVLKGVIDCPDLPLNVSRSALQNDGFVGKIAEYISKKVADKLSGMCKTDKEEYEKYWDDISPFIKYGCLKDEKFCDKMMDYVLFKNIYDQYMSLKECIEKQEKEQGSSLEGESEEEQGSSPEGESEEKEKTTLYYVTDMQQQSQYVNMFKEHEQDAVILSHNIDASFITQLEHRNQNIQFRRIDADVADFACEEVEQSEKEAFEETSKSLVEIFRKELGNEKLEVKVQKLKDEQMAAMMTLSEESRRMQDMMKMYAAGGMDPGMFGAEGSLILNADHPLVKYVAEHPDSDQISVICHQLYDLAVLAHRPLKPEEMTDFMKRSNEIMLLLTK